MALKLLADKLDKKVYNMLLFTVAVIPLYQDFTSLCVAVTFLYAFVAAFGTAGRKEAVLKGWQQGLLYLLMVIGIISLHFSPERFQSAFNYLYVAGQYAALVFLLLRYSWHKPVHHKEQAATLKEQFQQLPKPMQLLTAFLAVSVLVSIIGILQKIFGITAEGVWVDPQQFPDIKTRVYSTLVNPNILAGYLVLVIAYAAAFFSIFKQKKIRLLLTGCGLLAAICLLYTYSRGNWLACAGMLTAFCLLFYHKAFLPVMAVGAAGLAIGGSSVWHRLTSILSGQDTSMALRIAYFRSTKWIIEEFPQGVGWYGYQFIYPTYNYYLADTSVIMYHCHNLFLNVLAELGWHGLIVFLAVWGMFLYYGIKLAFNKKGLWTTAVGRGYVLASIGIAIGGLTDHVYFNTQMGLLFWLMGTLTLVTYKMDQE